MQSTIFSQGRIHWLYCLPAGEAEQAHRQNVEQDEELNPAYPILQRFVDIQLGAAIRLPSDEQLNDFIVNDESAQDLPFPILNSLAGSGVLLYRVTETAQLELASPGAESTRLDIRDLEQLIAELRALHSNMKQKLAGKN